MESSTAFLTLSAIAPQVILVLFGLIVLVVDLFSRQERGNLSALALVGIGVASFTTLQLWGKQGTVFGGMIVVDPFATFLTLLFLMVALFTVLLSRQYAQTVSEVHDGEYYALLLFATLGMILMAAGGDLLLVFLGLEILSLGQYILAGFLHNKPKSIESALKYFLLGAFATGFLLYGIALIYGVTGSTNIAQMHQFALQHKLGSDTLFQIGMGLILVGFGFKVAAVPFHMWTPDVYEGAPTPITAFMSTGPKIAGFAVLLRVFSVAFSLHPSWTVLFWILAALTMTVANIAAIMQGNIKRLLAYSSIAHAGYTLVALTAGSEAGAQSALFYLLAYLFMNFGAFAVVTLLVREEEAFVRIDEYAGLGYRHPLLGGVMALCMLSLAGIPPTAGFVGKFNIFGAAVMRDYVFLVILGVLNTLVSLYYYLRIVVVIYMQPSTKEETPLTLDPALLVALVLTSVGILYLGLFPGQVLQSIQQAVNGLMGP
jgi:NADH-quinone oxidoreductase subunit N